MVGSGEVAKDSLQTDENGLEINVSQKKEKQASGDDDWF